MRFTYVFFCLVIISLSVCVYAGNVSNVLVIQYVNDDENPYCSKREYKVFPFEKGASLKEIRARAIREVGSPKHYKIHIPGPEDVFSIYAYSEQEANCVAIEHVAFTGKSEAETDDKVMLHLKSKGQRVLSTAKSIYKWPAVVIDSPAAPEGQSTGGTKTIADQFEDLRIHMQTFRSSNGTYIALLRLDNTSKTHDYMVTINSLENDHNDESHLVSPHSKVTYSIKGRDRFSLSVSRVDGFQQDEMDLGDTVIDTIKRQIKEYVFDKNGNLQQKKATVTGVRG